MMARDEDDDDDDDEVDDEDELTTEQRVSPGWDTIVAKRAATRAETRETANRESPVMSEARPRSPRWLAMNVDSSSKELSCTMV